ncbi:SMP-30/gluconolactonase/LRE family protein [Nonlabens xiamenensis]|uniref:SMP-30/gluconolactonase/LRE family protein n=1 Tax=Nonlabens xiamenensis TaxID=2341043 RepID=UPI000F614934|nr:SMP-30/gluconolactonase/LRE family protein [Nonlabens xiamenensis]
MKTEVQLNHFLKPKRYQLLLVGLLLMIANTSCKEKTKDSSIMQTTSEQQSPTARLELEFQASLGEGALWNAKNEELYWIDIEGKKFHRYQPITGENKTIDLPSRPGTVVASTDEEALVALEDGIYKVSLSSGVSALFSDVEQEVTTNRFNDGKCDPNGNLWVGSMHLEQSRPEGKLYKITPEGNVQVMLDSVTISNGIVWNKNATTMFYIDTPTAKIRAFDYDVDTSTISNERTLVEVPETLGFPDGMAIDANDNLWVGLWNGNAVANYDSKTGKLIRTIQVPAHNVTSCAFGGKDLATLYITTARVDMTDEELNRFPLAGSLFSVEPGVKGVPASVFKTNLSGQ